MASYEDIRNVVKDIKEYQMDKEIRTYLSHNTQRLYFRHKVLEFNQIVSGIMGIIMVALTALSMAYEKIDWFMQSGAVCIIIPVVRVTLFALYTKGLKQVTFNTGKEPLIKYSSYSLIGIDIILTTVLSSTITAMYGIIPIGIVIYSVPAVILLLIYLKMLNNLNKKTESDHRYISTYKAQSIIINPDTPSQEEYSTLDYSINITNTGDVEVYSIKASKVVVATHHLSDGDITVGDIKINQQDYHLVID